MKVAILFATVLFACYAQYDAKNTIDANARNKKMAAASRADVESADLNFMERAIELSHQAHRLNAGYPFGAVVVTNGAIIGEGINNAKKLGDLSAHAEVEAVDNALKNSKTSSLKGSVIYASAQPCSMCLERIAMAGIEKVYYCIPSSLSHELDNSLSHITPKEHNFGTVKVIPIMQDKVQSVFASY